MPAPLLIARSSKDLFLLPQMANRHGLIAGATGTGKTVSLQVMAEALSGIGVPVFMADVKGDLAGISQPGGGNPKVQERIKKLALENFAFAASPVTFWDVFGREGHPVRATAGRRSALACTATCTWMARHARGATLRTDVSANRLLREQDAAP